MIANPKKVTLARWWKISLAPYSILRNLEYECISKIKLDGRTIDIGGGSNTSYAKLLNINGVMETLNISAEMKPTYQCDLNFPIPIESNAYDNAISFNTFEHIENDCNAISEVFRILKPGGKFFFVVPFLYKVHGSPFDFHRHTAKWWENYLIQCGADAGCLNIEPLSWDPTWPAFSHPPGFISRSFVARILRSLYMFSGVVMQTSIISRKPSAARMQNLSDNALGYFISGKKKD